MALQSFSGGLTLKQSPESRPQVGRTRYIKIETQSLLGGGTDAQEILEEGLMPAMAIVGDACFTMNGMELLTAAEYGIPVVWLVENNQMHGITWHGSKLVSGGRPMQSIRYRRALEVAAIARAMGLPAWIVDEPDRLQDVLAEALAVKGPAVIEIRVDSSISPPLGDRAKSVAGFKGHE